MKISRRKGIEFGSPELPGSFALSPKLAGETG
jgi:hypothetical protein